ncbi:SdiA-regulated domain-containing protein [Fulvivirgaceae bacterium BMA10]|uniref:SdiA-regulated domain-containing protein n=1 Tax=Splendidivirga corallicola TaxID=3051826 RepID=A0ABT8KQ36_9BACT|nr:SdiA-regulated domain-containing protein [Fulvivirgaceae bacterium BMA10]
MDPKILQFNAKFYLILLISFALGVNNYAQINNPEIELIDIKQLHGDHKNQFDLSGIVQTNNKLYVVANQHWNNYIYEIELKGDFWNIKNSVPLGLTDPIALEGLDYYNNGFYIINEKGNLIYVLAHNGKMTFVNVDYSNVESNLASHIKNAGLSAIAINDQDTLLYLSKRNNSRYLIEVDLNHGKVNELFDVPESEGRNFCDMKFENNFLYLLDSRNDDIIKLDIKTKEIINKVSYRKSSTTLEGKILEKQSQFGAAGALLLTKNEIWIGIDDRTGRAPRTTDNEGIGSVNRPAILRFKRPSWF